jgi:plastocyanin
VKSLFASTAAAAFAIAALSGVHALADDVPASPRGTVRGTITIDGKSVSRKYKFEEAVVNLIDEALDKASPPPPAEPAIMDQNGIAYVPTILAIQAGTKVEFRNSDPTLHNVHCSCVQNTSLNRGSGPGQNFTVVFDKPEVIEVTCNIHAAMKAFIVVLPNAFFTKPSASGEFTIANVPAGTWKIKAWHDGTQVVTGTVTVKAGEDCTTTLDLAPKKTRGR